MGRLTMGEYLDLEDVFAFFSLYQAHFSPHLSYLSLKSDVFLAKLSVLPRFLTFPFTLHALSSLTRALLDFTMRARAG